MKYTYLSISVGPAKHANVCYCWFSDGDFLPLIVFFSLLSFWHVNFELLLKQRSPIMHDCMTGISTTQKNWGKVQIIERCIIEDMGTNTSYSCYYTRNARNIIEESNGTWKHYWKFAAKLLAFYNTTQEKTEEGI